MKKNKWLPYLAYAIILLCYIIAAYKISIFQYNKMKTSFMFLPYLTWSAVLCFVLGFLLGFEKLMFEIKKKGTWKINLPRLILLGVPFFYIAFSTLIYYCSPAIFIQQAFSYPVRYLASQGINFISISQVIFGYIVCTSFVKVKN